MSEAILAVAVLALCALAWRRHAWHVQRARIDRVFLTFRASTEELDSAFRRLSRAVQAAGWSIQSSYRTPEQLQTRGLNYPQRVIPWHVEREDDDT